MENKHVGFIILGIAALEAAVIFLFRSALREIVAGSCTGEHGLSCPMYTTIDQQSYLAFAMVGVLLIIGLALVFTKPKEKIVVKTIKEKRVKKKVDISDLRADDKKVFNIIQENGTIFQADLIEKTGFSKQKTSRIIDRLEGRNIVERKRRGMTNVVVLKE